MTEKNSFKKRIPCLCRSLLAAAICAGLLLTGCGDAQKTEVADSASGTTAAQTAATQTAAKETTAAQAAAASTAAESAATAETGAQYADPDWSADDSGSGFSARGKGLLIVIDPGHTSQVPDTTEPVGPGSSEMKEADTVGTYGPASGLHEYELTMDVSQKLRAELEDRGYDVMLTHHDTFNPISCVERAAVANDNDADVFLRIHANGSENTEANGAMTICITQENPYHPDLYSASSRLSEIILDTYCEETQANREYVWETDTMTGNNWAEMPATLIELGYMTNPDEDLRMNQDSYQKLMAKAIADGLDRWFAQMPEEELSMHPSLTQENDESAETAGTSSTGETADTASTDETAGASSTDETAAESADDTADESGGTAAGTSTGNGTGVSTDPTSVSE